MISSLIVVILAVVLIASAIAVVSAQDLVHGVFWLAVVLIATAGLYLSLASPFIAAIQLVLYTGGIITLMLFGVMLTHRHSGSATVPNDAHRQLPGALTAGALLAVMLAAIWRTELPQASVDPGDAAAIGVFFLGPQLLAFEALSLLLLAAMIGAIVLARRVDP